MLLAAAVALGGGQGGLGDTFLQLFALALLGYLLAASASHRRQLLSLRSPAWVALIFLAVPLLHLVHSVVDYPLRTSSNQAVFALLLAVLLSWRWHAAFDRHAPTN